MQQLEGVVSQIVFRNEDNGYTVFEVKVERKTYVSVGVLPALSQGEHVRLTGDWSEHPDYGTQFKCQLCEPMRPTELADIERYLASGIVSGIGPATAKMMIERFGSDAFRILDEDCARLTELPGIGKKRAQRIHQAWQEQSAMRVSMVFLQKHGLTPAAALKIYKAYGDRAVEMIQQNPYRLVSDVFGVGFQTADRIAYSMGMPADSPFRLMAGITYVLSDAAASGGHTYLPKDDLSRQGAALLNAPQVVIENTITELAIDGKVMQVTYPEHVAVYLPAYAKAEAEVANRLSRLCMLASTTRTEVVENQIHAYERERNLQLAPAQRDAVHQAASGGVLVITGGPGTGKTTTLDCILGLFTKRGATVLLAAPTGRAAKRMAEATGRKAQTLHRLLEYGGAEDSAFQRDEDNPLEADVLIVDEMSMVDLLVFRAMLRALSPNTQLILVGDEDQLPSVGAGNVLGDIVASGVLPVVRLTEIFRQAQESLIVMSAHRINKGEMPLYNQKDGDFFLERQPTPTQTAEAVVELVTRRLPRFIGCEACRIQVLSPTKKGDAGVHALNRALQQALNPPAHEKGEIVYGNTTFRLGDKVMQIRNNYQAEWTMGQEDGRGVFNGDMGTIIDIEPDERALMVRFDDEREVQYVSAMLEELELSYCVTVHKSQGSEFPAVVIPITGGPPMLMTRNLLYTAVTRARQLVVLVGREAVVQSMVQNHHVAHRYSALELRMKLLCGACGEEGPA